jgi:MarC family integral membrane protein
VDRVYPLSYRPHSGNRPLFCRYCFSGNNRQSSEVERRHIARVVSLTVVATGRSGVTGETVLRVLGANLASFRVGGGIVLLLMALAMLNGRSKRTQSSRYDLASCPWRYRFWPVRAQSVWSLTRCRSEAGYTKQRLLRASSRPVLASGWYCGLQSRSVRSWASAA